MHLTLTGFHAGKTLCGSERVGGEVHAMYAPLDKEEFRNQVCPDCLKEYALSYEDEIDTAPEWVLELLGKDHASKD